MTLPQHFCWTRFGTEAGEPIGKIISRKENERKANGGIFLWGIGNAVGPSIRELVRREPTPEVVFSPISTRPRQEDVEPEQVAVWTRGVMFSGKEYKLPNASFVTSRLCLNGKKRSHYALVCSTDDPLTIDDMHEPIQFSHLSNLLSGRKIGSSQVTAVVQLSKNSDNKPGRIYPVSLRANLVHPFFVELTNPVVITDKDRLEESRKMQIDLSSIQSTLSL